MKENNIYDDKLGNLFRIISLNLNLCYMFDTLINALCPKTKKELEARIIFLESELITKYAKYNEEIVVP